MSSRSINTGFASRVNCILDKGVCPETSNKVFLKVYLDNFIFLMLNFGRERLCDRAIYIYVCVCVCVCVHACLPVLGITCTYANEEIYISSFT